MIEKYINLNDFEVYNIFNFLVEYNKKIRKLKFNICLI